MSMSMDKIYICKLHLQWETRDKGRVNVRSDTVGDNFNTGKVRSRLINFINWEGGQGKKSEEEGAEIDQG